jgi:hypothetical protein
MQSARFIGEKTKRLAIVGYILRVLGLLVGAMCIVFGSLAVIEDGPLQLRHILMLLNFVGMGLLFCWYGVTGRTRLPVPSGRAGLFLLWGLGGLVITIGAYTLLFDDTASALGKTVLFLCAVSGAWLIVVGVILRKRLLVSRRDR